MPPTACRISNPRRKNWHENQNGTSKWRQKTTRQTI
jgi:hypothetical protein